MNGKLRYYSLIFVISLLSILTSNCGKLLSPFFDYEEELNNYPSIIYSLSDEELQQLQVEFESLNDNIICTRLNKFGLTGDDYYYKHIPEMKISDENMAINYAINGLLRNKKFTNITDSNELVKSGFQIRNVNDDSTRWSIRFGPQKYRGYEVFRSKIEVGLCGYGVYYIDGFWYKDICVPPIDIISKEEARNKVIGRKIIWLGYGGGPNEFIVTENLVDVYIEKIIYPFEKEDTIKLRVAWQIPIIFGSFIGWHIYIDTTTGEEIAIIQLFRT